MKNARNSFETRPSCHPKNLKLQVAGDFMRRSTLIQFQYIMLCNVQMHCDAFTAIKLMHVLKKGLVSFFNLILSYAKSSMHIMHTSFYDVIFILLTMGIIRSVGWSY